MSENFNMMWGGTRFCPAGKDTAALRRRQIQELQHYISLHH
jgi:hypothetical protein